MATSISGQAVGQGEGHQATEVETPSRTSRSAQTSEAANPPRLLDLS
ncbi:MAG: hypothetical protein HY690_04750 [Chloroflexi bacterium]|nr:hypothetical protein [Chloroflexota bacterium]